MNYAFQETLERTPCEDPQPICAAAVMMHSRSARGASSSWQGGCPRIDEQQEWAPPVPAQQVIYPNPDYKIEANVWQLDIRHSAFTPGPIASFLRHCNTMDSPPMPSYLKGGPLSAQDITHLGRELSMKNLREPQRYAGRLQFESTCARLWVNGIQDQIADETEKAQGWISGMIGELNQLRRVQPAWIQHMQVQASQQPSSSMTQSASAPAQASSSSASMVPVKAAPCSKNSSMASAPKNPPFPSTQGADPWRVTSPGPDRSMQMMHQSTRPQSIVAAR